MLQRHAELSPRDQEAPNTLGRTLSTDRFRVNKNTAHRERKLKTKCDFFSFSFVLEAHSCEEEPPPV